MSKLHPEITGIVYGVVLNDARTIASLGQTLKSPPHLVPPSAPVLYIKPRNTLTGPHSRIAMPAGVKRLEIAATLGLVIARRATRISVAGAHQIIRGYTIVVDMSLPGAGLHRPPVVEKCFDGSCPVGPTIVSPDQMPPLEDIKLTTSINGAVTFERDFKQLVRDPAQLIADVTEFMTLEAGDVLTLGVLTDPPVAGPDDMVCLEADPIGRLEVMLTSGEGVDQ